MKKNIGIIGLGYWGPNILRILKSNDGVNIKYICDLSDEVINKYKNDFFCTKNYFDILNDMTVDIVFVITPISTHYKIIIDCIKYNKSVYVEKPICKTQEELDKIYELSSKNGCKVFCDYTFTHSDKINKLKELINQEQNKILYIEMNRETFGIFSFDNVIYDLLPHDVSILYHIFNADIKINNYQHIKFDDLIIKSVINFSINNINGIINLSWLNESKERKIKIFCKDKIIEYNDISDNIHIFYYHLLMQDNKIEQYKKNSEDILNINYKEPLKTSIDTFFNILDNKDENSYIQNKELNNIIIDCFEKIL